MPPNLPSTSGPTPSPTRKQFFPNAADYSGSEYLDWRERDGQLRGRILYDGLEVATLSYAEDYRFGELYAKAPALLAACRKALPFLQYLATNGSGNTKAAEVCDLIENAIKPFEGR